MEFVTAIINWIQGIVAKVQALIAKIREGNDRNWKPVEEEETTVIA